MCGSFIKPFLPRRLTRLIRDLAALSGALEFANSDIFGYSHAVDLQDEGFVLIVGFSNTGNQQVQVSGLRLCARYSR